MSMQPSDLKPFAGATLRRVSFEQARQQQRDEASSMSIAERVLAGWEMRENDLFRERNLGDTSSTGITIRRIQRSWR
jgi:hypothetical protein